MTDSAITPDEARTMARERVQLEVRAIMLAMVAQPGTPLPDAFDEHFARALDLYGRVMHMIGGDWAIGAKHGADCGSDMCLKCYIDGEFVGLYAELERADGRTG